MFLTTRGLFTCGWNKFGQMGTGVPIRYYSLVKVTQVEGRPLSVACGPDATMLITTVGLFACGGGEGGGLGLGNNVDIPYFTRVPFIMGRPLSTVCGGEEIVLTTTDGVFSCRRQYDGNAVFPTFEKVLLDGKVLSIGCGFGHIMIITTKGLFSRGRNIFGQLAVGDPDYRGTFVHVEVQGTPLDVACGSFHNILLTTDGLFGSGSNSSGELGFRGAIDTVVLRFEKMKTLTIPFFMACGGSHTMLLSTEGLSACGNNLYAQLGYHSQALNITELTPSPIAGLPLNPVEEEGPERKKRHMGCRICDTGAPKMRQETANPHRLFCTEMCQKKFHYFDHLMRMSFI